MLRNIAARLIKSNITVHGIRNSHSEAIRNIGADAYDWFVTREANDKDLKNISKVIDNQKWTFSEKLTDLDFTYTDYKKDNVELELHAHYATGISLTAIGEGSKEKLEEIKKEFLVLWKDSKANPGREFLKKSFSYMQKSPVELKKVGPGLFTANLPDGVKAEVLSGGAEMPTVVSLFKGNDYFVADIDGIFLKNWTIQPSSPSTPKK